MAFFNRKPKVPPQGEESKAEKPLKKSEAQPLLKARGDTLSAFATETLLAPLVTEKSAHLADRGVYAFRVPLTANRVSIRAAFHEVYKVMPTAIRIMRVHGKEGRFGRTISRASDTKKALVSVPKGTRLDIFTS